MTEDIRPFRLNIPQSELDDLQRRLDATRWPDRELVQDWSQGAPLEKIRDLVEYWRTRYDWRRCEAFLNGLNQHQTAIDGVDIYFQHIRSPSPQAVPLIMTHGWPGSVTEFFKVIGPLTDPESHGGNASDAFHLVLPALPGFGFSGKPTELGWNAERIARAWSELMPRIGYDRYFAQGGDWGAVITSTLAHQKPEGLMGIHLNFGLVVPPPPYDDLSDREAEALKDIQNFGEWETGYHAIQSTRPQTLGFGLADSPAGQAAWIYEKFMRFSDSDGDPLNIFSYDELIDNIMVYWLSNSATSAARIYWGSTHSGFGAVEIDVPAGFSVFPKEVYRAPRSWAERCMHQLVYWNELDKGGHFAAAEQPALFTEEVRACFRKMR